MKGKGVVGVRTKGEVKGGGTEKTEKERKTQNERDCHFNPSPAGVHSGTKPARFQKGPVKEGAPCLLPTGVIKPRNQPVVRRLWDSNPQLGLSPMLTPVYRDLPLQPTPSGTSLVSRKIKLSILV